MVKLKTLLSSSNCGNVRLCGGVRILCGWMVVDMSTPMVGGWLFWDGCNGIHWVGVLV